MTEAINQHEKDEPLDEMKDLTAQWANYFNGIQHVLEENERLRQRVAALESENAALTDTLEQWKKGDDWSISRHEIMHSLSFLCKATKNNGSKI